MKLKSIITISGRIKSGKSFTADLIKKGHGIKVASFGAYLMFFCEKNNFPTDRKTLQDKGEEFVQANPRQFLIDVVSHFRNSSDIIIIEGVRHKSIFEATKTLADNHFSIFVETDLKMRYQRYSQRNQYSDTTKTYNDFLIVDNHPVELETESLKDMCNLILNGNSDYSNQLKSELDIFCKF